MITAKDFQPVLWLAGVMCGVQVLNLLSGYSLNTYGLLPRSAQGLLGIISAPFLHGSLWHLLGNLVPFIVLGTLVAKDGVGRFLAASGLIIVVGGLLVWLFGRGYYHVGASGWVFGLWVYVVARAWFHHSWANLLCAAAAMLLYGGLVYGFLPRYGVSFESHIAGAVAGFVAARVLLRKEEGV
ncbi:rhomboid family intramembrane serine protease [Pseudomonas sp. RIT-To-2]|uniref:rhomboid family intramembrane serine protease n=1 Tax=Pseudomonas sp. RIT-To-2 TaxID=3462541 RepID=UPI0040479AED